MKSTALAAVMLFVGSLSTLEASDLGWVDLFNGKDLEGWTQKNGTASYRVDGDTIVGKTQEGSPNSFLCTDQLYGDFELKFEVKVDNELNSGVQIRSQTTDGTNT
ncbi:MAG: 3-keto-disaccharide hydrolase, partial [Rubripirellula sp.]